MPRGRLLRTKIREEKALARARLEGERQFYRTQKGSIHWLKKELIAVFKSKPVEIIAFISTTILVYKTLEKVEDIVQWATKEKRLTPLPEKRLFWPEWRLIPGEGVEIFKLMGLENWQLILLSMTIAYLIMRHGFEIMGGIVSGARMLLGLS